MSHTPETATSNDYKLPATGGWADAWKIAAGVGIAGVAGCIAAASIDPSRAAFSYLFAFEAVLSLALGMLFFVLIQHLTSSGWSVTVRRTAEFFASALPVMFILFLPILFRMNELFPWVHAGEHGGGHGEHASITLVREARADVPAHPGATEEGHVAKPAEPHHAGKGEHVENVEHPAAAHTAGHLPDPHHVEHESILKKKAPYLNKGFFIGRAVFYFIVWSLLGIQFFKNSTKQDQTKDAKHTLDSQRMAPVATFLFGITLTFAAVDWIMSLEPSWFSTIFGVYIFATGVVSSLAMLILVTMSLNEAGILKNKVNVEHYHDIGKLLFGFNVFWAYIGFSQFMLIWYAALPEETTWYHRRWDNGPWAGVSMFLLTGHFIVPFFLLISRNVKRRLPLLKLGALIMVLMHVVDLYWFVMPNYAANLPDPNSFSFSWMDLVSLFAVAGVYFAAVFFTMKKHSLIPVGDPRLPRALSFENA